MLYIFTLTLILSSGLLFLVQPMFAKMLLPQLGGSPSVWNVCMVFYQTALLAGYLYAHWATSKLTMRSQTLLHLGLLFFSSFCLPIQIAKHLPSLEQTNPILWSLLSLGLSVGLPFFTISANNITIQKWFTNTRHPSARDPYFLYQASNLGSILGLLSYPFLMETHLKLVEQSWIWSIGYALLIALVASCAFIALQKNKEMKNVLNDSKNLEPSSPNNDDTPTIGPFQKCSWVILSFVPSSLMLGVTTYLSNDIAPFPLLWIIPFSIYLLTFVFSFARRPFFSQLFLVKLEAILLPPLVLLMITQATRPVWLVTSLHLLTLFVIAMTHHMELAKRRPPFQRLTSFYLWLSVGGILGGLFNGIIGPLIFNKIIEYPLTLVFAGMLIPKSAHTAQEASKINWLDVGFPIALGILSLTLLWLFHWFNLVPKGMSLKPLLAIPAVICFLFSNRPIRFGLSLGTLMAASVFYAHETGRPIQIERSFFGLHRVVIDPENKYHWLIHGVTVHGGQSLDPLRAREPLAYYHPTGPIGQLFKMFLKKTEKARVAVIGLGTGSLISYAQEGSEWNFYEIDPTVQKIAQDQRYFTFLQQSRTPYKIILGDARQTLSQTPNQKYDFLIVDAFSSDAIPLHLITREAIQLYLSKLAQAGLLAFHITNRYLQLQSVLGGLAEDAGLIAFDQEDMSDASDIQNGKFSSRWVVMFRDSADAREFSRDVRWKQFKAQRGGKVWSDDFSNVFSIFSWN